MASKHKVSKQVGPKALGIYKPAVRVQGKYLPSVMLRVDLAFANFVKGEALKASKSDGPKVGTPEITRHLLQALTDEGGK